jgi:ABC-type glycerol-3-phosphate transport system substrate-binding protein
MRTLVLIICACLFLTGCQAGSATAPLATNTTSAAPTSPSMTPDSPALPSATQVLTPTLLSKIDVKAQSLRGVRLAFWYPWTGDLAKEVDAAVAEFNQSNIWGITVVASGQGSVSAMEDLLAQSAQNQALPQIVAAPPEVIAQLQQDTAQIIDLKPYYSDPQWGYTPSEIDDFFPNFWKEADAGDLSFSIPILRSMPILFYNQTWAKELGFTSAPATVADFRTQSCAAAKANRLSGNPDLAGTGGWIVDTSAPTIYSWLAAGGGIPDQVAADPFTFDNPNNESTFAFLRKMMDDSCIWISRNPTPATYFSQRLALFYSGTLSDLPALAKNLVQQKSTDLWQILAYPADSPNPTILTFGSSLAILKSDPAKQLAAWLFLRWMTLPRLEAGLAAAGSILPVRKSALDLMTLYKNANPQWNVAAGWLNASSSQKTIPSMPAQTWWTVGQRVLEDASWQIFQPAATPPKIPDILQELDATIKELLTKK